MRAARFLVVMRRVFGFELAPVRGAVDQGTKKLMDNLFDAFDEDGSDKMPWRNILIMLHVVCFPTREPADHLRWGFALVGSEGSFDMENVNRPSTLELRTPSTCYTRWATPRCGPCSPN